MSTWRDEGREPTGVELRDWLNTLTEEKLEEVVQRQNAAFRTASGCIRMNHEEVMRRELERTPEEATCAAAGRHRPRLFLGLKGAHVKCLRCYHNLTGSFELPEKLGGPVGLAASLADIETAQEWAAVYRSTFEEDAAAGGADVPDHLVCDRRDRAASSLGFEDGPDALACRTVTPWRIVEDDQ